MAILKIKQEMVRNGFNLPYNKWALGYGGKWVDLGKTITIFKSDNIVSMKLV